MEPLLPRKIPSWIQCPGKEQQKRELGAKCLPHDPTSSWDFHHDIRRDNGHPTIICHLCLIDEDSEGRESHVVQMGPCRAGADQIRSHSGLCLVGKADEFTGTRASHVEARTVEAPPAHPPPPGLLLVHFSSTARQLP